MAGTGTAHLRPAGARLVSVEDLVVEFPVAGKGTVHAVSGISLDVLPGETLGLVGESGCGKSTTGKAILQLPPPTSGSIKLEGTELTTLPAADVRAARRKLQIILQDPISSLNPRRRIRDIVAEGLAIWGERPDPSVVDDLLSAVGLDPAVVGDRRPSQMSGGQCQRVCIARALALNPSVLVCDEPVSALDVSVQAQIINLLEDMKRRFDLTMVFIAHDLAVVRSISDRVAVMYLGKICEVGEAARVYERPSHPYTRMLLDSIPEVGVTEASDYVPPGEIPSPMKPPSGCRFRTRCERATARCAEEEPQIRRVGSADEDQFVACHHPLVDVVPVGVAKAPGEAV